MTSKFSIDNRELLQRISSGEAVVGIDFGNLIVRELAAFRLAAMDSEPVALHMGEAINVFNALKVEQLSERVNNAGLGPMGASNVQVWTSKAGGRLEFISANGGCTLNIFPHPAPVVPDEIYARTAFEAWYKTKYAFQGYEFEITDSGTYVWDNVNHMWNGYRAAMLAAATHDTHALNSVQSVDSVAGKWIPVSERLPDIDGDYLCWGAYYEGAPKSCIPASYFIHPTHGWAEWNPMEDDCNPKLVKITHWMPLPAAPQEPKP